MAVEAKIDGKVLVLRIDLEPPHPSASGKTIVVASSHGSVKTTAMIDGKPVVVGVNAYLQR